MGARLDPTSKKAIQQAQQPELQVLPTDLGLVLSSVSDIPIPPRGSVGGRGRGRGGHVGGMRGRGGRGGRIRGRGGRGGQTRGYTVTANGRKQCNCCNKDFSSSYFTRHVTNKLMFMFLLMFQKLILIFQLSLISHLFLLSHWTLTILVNLYL